MLTDALLECLEHLKFRLELLNAVEIHFAIVNSERPIRYFFDFYACLTDNFADTPLSVILHDRVYVSIASIACFPKNFRSVYLFVKLV